jgi:hypothetical protein
MDQIDLTGDPDPQDQEAQINANGKRSWVWTHFNRTDCGEKLQCMVMLKSGKECGALLARDLRSSTKGMSDHLIAKHKLGDPSKKSKQMGMMERFTATGKNPRMVCPLSLKFNHIVNFCLPLKSHRLLHLFCSPTLNFFHLSLKPRLTSASLKTAIVYLICDCDLSFKMMEKESFRRLLRLCNQETTSMLVKEDALSRHLRDVFLFHQELLQSKLLAEAPAVAYTLDAWTAPNNTAFMAITAHTINSSFEKVDVLLGIPHIQGKLVS